MREIVLASWFTTQTAPSPTATSPGVLPTGISATISFDEGSIAATAFPAIDPIGSDPLRVSCQARRRCSGEDQRPEGYQDHGAAAPVPRGVIGGLRRAGRRWPCGCSERRILVQDLPLELLEGRRGLDSELVDEGSPTRLEDLERLGLAA